MSGEAWLYLFAVLINAVNLFLQVFFTIMYSDLEWCVSSTPESPGYASYVCLRRLFRPPLPITSCSLLTRYVF